LKKFYSGLKYNPAMESAGTNPIVSIIIVAYRSINELRELLPLLFELSRCIAVEIAIVDNRSDDGTEELLREQASRIIYIKNDENRGFAAAVNQAVLQTSAPQILLLNPDARLDPVSLGKLSSFLTRHPDAGAAAPRIIYPDGRLQPSRGSFPTLLTALAHLTGIKHLMPDDESIMKGPFGFLGRFFKQYSHPLEVQEVDYTTGACVLLKRQALDEVRGLDERFFLYYEEIDLAVRLNNAGYKWFFLEEAEARHSVAAASGKDPLRPFFERYRSMLLYFCKNTSAFQTAIVRRMLAAMILFRWACGRLSPRFRIDPNAPWSEETSVFKRLLKLDI
jgi:N-acetylglucosaminyl-diphospho-decaprenol L-rhamnosyltransferase